MLEIRFSNRFELLAELFAARIAARRGSPFESDVLLVPSTAIKRRLTLIWRAGRASVQTCRSTIWRNGCGAS